MTLRFYRAYPFIPQNVIDQADQFTGDGSTTTYTLANKTTSHLAPSVLVDLNQYTQITGGFTVINSTQFTMAVAPAINSQILAPGTVALTFSAFDQPVIPGVSGTTANVDTETFWLADDGLGTNNIFNNTFNAAPNSPGVAIFFQNLVTAAGAQTFWMQLACADGNGNALTYGATGTTLYTGAFQAYSTLTASASASTKQLYVTNAAQFTPGDYFWVNPSGGTYENARIKIGRASCRERVYVLV